MSVNNNNNNNTSSSSSHYGSAPSARNRERILEAIDQLRKRKARPDNARICGYLFRRFHVNSADAKADLEWCVANNIVLKVEYKGSISYRNAAKKWAQMRHRETQNLTNNPNALNKLAISRNFMELLTNVFGELVMEDPDYLEDGVPPKRIVDTILNKDNARYTRNYIAILLVKQVERGNLIKLKNGNFLLGPCADDKRPEWMTKETEENFYEISADNNSNKKRKQIHRNNKTTEIDDNNVKEEKIDSEEEKNNSTNNESRNVRFGSRRKKARKVFDPSDNNIPKKRGRPAGSLNKTCSYFPKREDDSRPNSRTSNGSRDRGGVCSVCHTQSKKPSDRMIACRECSNKAHYSCLNGDDMMLKLSPDNTWQCPFCKTCVVCYETSDAGNLIICSVCTDAYHATCHQPRIVEKIKNGQKWLCVNCQITDEMKPNEIQSNIGESVSHKITINEDNEKEGGDGGGEESIKSNSGCSSSSESIPASPTEMSQKDSPEQDPSDSNSGKDSEPEDPNIDPTIPDATHWTPDEVYEYFAQFFPEEAKVFKEQEIDGRSLLLLKRLDVLTNLNLKLGPALKIYRHVTMLQVRRDDRRLYWL